MYKFQLFFKLFLFTNAFVNASDIAMTRVQAQELVRRGIDPRENAQALLEEGIRCDDCEMVDFALKYNADPNLARYSSGVCLNDTCLMYALDLFDISIANMPNCTLNKSKNIIFKLIDSGKLNLNAGTYLPLLKVLHSFYHDGARNLDGMRAIQAVAHRLIRKGANVNQEIDPFDLLPFDFAISCKMEVTLLSHFFHTPQAMEFLLKHGACPDKKHECHDEFGKCLCRSSDRDLCPGEIAKIERKIEQETVLVAVLHELAGVRNTVTGSLEHPNETHLLAFILNKAFGHNTRGAKS